MESGAVAVLAADLHAIDREFVDVALIHVGHELAEVEFCILLAVARPA